MTDGSPRPSLIVFIDARPFDDLVRTPRLARWSAHRLKPGLGYSINLHAELFAGLTPDEVGFFGEWTFDPATAPGRRLKRWLPLLDGLLRPYWLNRGLQALLTRRYRPDRIMPNIPLARLADFGIRGEKATAAEFPAETIFTRYPDLRQVERPGLVKGRRDAALVQEAARLVEAGATRVYLALPDLDGIGHTGRRGGPAWQTHLAWLDGAVDRLADRFLARHPGANVLAVSDHGMANVAAGVPFRPEAAVGPQSSQRYVVFTDSTLVRIWVNDPRLTEPLAAVAKATPHLALLTPDERRLYGVTDPAFGTHIGVLDEGYCFQPSTFARRIPAAMHGYHPDVASQHAVLLHRGADPPPSVGRTRDVFHALDIALGGKP
jgi:hypothetical protein